MKKIVIALTLLAGIVFMSGCAYDPYYYYYTHYDPHYGHYVEMV
jgi:hypothetical protein